MGSSSTDHDLGVVVSRFVDELRRRGMTFGTNQSVRFAEGLVLTSGGSVRDVAVATLATSPDDMRIIDEVLAPEPATANPDVTHLPPLSGDARFSSIEVLRRHDVARCSDDERAEIRRRLRRMTFEGERRRSRRHQPRTPRGSLDLRATLRAATRADGELLQLGRRARRHITRRVVLLLDVSGSMEPYARMMLQLAHAGVVGRGDIEVFALGTRLTRLTRQLSSRDPDAAFEAAVGMAPDWGGGTRLGATVRAINDDPTTRGFARGAIVVLVSDGLDRGDPIELGEQMQRLTRVAHRTIWVNPLRATEGYEPTAMGMRAALPYVDDFVDGHSLQAFEDLASLVARPTSRRSVAASRRTPADPATGSVEWGGGQEL